MKRRVRGNHLRAGAGGSEADVVAVAIQARLKARGTVEQPCWTEEERIRETLDCHELNCTGHSSNMQKGKKQHAAAAAASHKRQHGAGLCAKLLCSTWVNNI